AAAFGVVAVCNHAVVPHGLPLAGVLVVIFLVILTFLAKRTTFGRHVYAVGGNAEAARRAGINVPRIRVLVFMISGAMAAIGGIILAANVNSVDLNFGGGTLLLNSIAAAVMGGVSLFGGRGEVRAAFLGALVIATVSNGLNTAGYSTGVIYVVTGVILLAAVTPETSSANRAPTDPATARRAGRRAARSGPGRAAGPRRCRTVPSGRSTALGTRGSGSSRSDAPTDTCASRPRRRSRHRSARRSER